VQQQLAGGGFEQSVPMVCAMTFTQASTVATRSA